MTIPPGTRNLIDQAYALAGDALKDLGPTPNPTAAATDVRRTRTKLIELKKLLFPAVPVRPIVRPILGAIIVNAGATPALELAQAGFDHVAVQLPVAPMDETKMRNLTELRDLDYVRRLHTAGIENVGGWFVSFTHVNPEAAEAAQLVSRFNLDFVIADTEHLKADYGNTPAQQLELWRRQNALWGLLRTYLGPNYPLGNITFGRHSSPQVVDNDSLKAYGINDIREAYDENSVTEDVTFCTIKQNDEGFRPANIAVGCYNVEPWIPALRKLRETGNLGDVWLYAAEQNLAAIAALGKALND